MPDTDTNDTDRGPEDKRAEPTQPGGDAGEMGTEGLPPAKLEGGDSDELPPAELEGGDSDELPPAELEGGDSDELPPAELEGDDSDELPPADVEGEQTEPEWLGGALEAVGYGDVSPRMASILESLLFVSEKPIPLAALCKALGERGKKRARRALEALAALRQNSGVQVVEVAGGYQMRTHPNYAGWVRRLAPLRPYRLSRAALEVLSIVAYRQPITRADIDDIRGVDCGGVLRLLLERGLIRVLGKKDEPGRPILWGTSTEFLSMFGLRDLNDLPSLREFQALDEEQRMALGIDEDMPRATAAAGDEPVQDIHAMFEDDGEFRRVAETKSDEELEGALAEAYDAGKSLRKVVTKLKKAGFVEEKAKKAEAQEGAEQPGAAQPGAEQPGAAQPGTEPQAAAGQPAAAQPGAAQPGTEPQAAAGQPAAAQPGTEPKAAAGQPAAAQPGAEKPAGKPAGKPEGKPAEEKPKAAQADDAQTLEQLATKRLAEGPGAKGRGAKGPDAKGPDAKGPDAKGPEGKGENT